MMRKEPFMVAAASGDPFYVFKDEVESTVSTVKQMHAKLRACLEAQGSPAANELPSLTHQMEGAIATAEKSVKFLEDTIVMVEANRSKFEHIDAAEISCRKEFVATIRKDLQTLLNEISSDTIQSQIRKLEHKRSTSFDSFDQSMPEKKERFLRDEAQRQSQIIKEQDENLAGLRTDLTRLHGVTIEISNEATHQNKMLDELTVEVDEAQERMNFVVARLSTLLKTKDTCQLGLILFLVAVLTVMVFLVVYT
ncbi:hypothetical protein CCR75_008214 [Bremia lactucae]|uniref:t-SNARE coiled-coil homology domain-containing protein n=1 Tax=Bremia lactucae TaxID=4779 RepID=A0A976IGI1_BRELC|nr:hypothetical protein CCR75_008214 [Bremia lactucae]